MQAASAPYEYSALPHRAVPRFPHGARVAVYVGLNVETYDSGAAIPALLPAVADRPADPINAGWRDYGPRVGVWRLSDILAEAGITPTALLNSDVCRRYPQIIDHGRERQWCWVAHGRSNSEWTGPTPPRLSRDDERAYLSEMLETITAATGRRPRGWLGPLGLSQTPNTAELLGELGFEYLLDWAADDQPFALNQPGLISVPYSFEINDLPPLMRAGLTGPEFGQMIIDQFDVLYAEGATHPRVLPIAIHPFVAGQAFRARHLRRALAHIAGHDHVWLCTSDELAAWYRSVTPSATPAESQPRTT
jgi:allantoinase